MRLSKKILLLAAGAAALIFGLVQLYSFFRYTLYREYRELTAQTYVDASKEFEALQDSGEGVPGMELVSESETLKLYASAKTAEIAILDKRNSKVWRSNPEDIDDDSIANKVNKSLLKSQLVLEYYDANRRPGNYNSYDYSVSRGQVEMSAIEGGVRFTYVLGDLESKTGIVPIYITQERLDFFMEALAQAEDGAAGVTYITSRYRDAGTVPGFLELMGNESVGASTLRRLRENFEKAGYTKDDFESDMMASEVEGAVPVSFTVCVDYRVEGDSLVCRIPKDLLDEGVGASISGIQLLRGLGAGGPQETGFALVPDGSGALMRFNNGKTSSEDYIQAVYGIDPMYMDFTVVGNTEKARLPIFGSSHEDSSILALIERGDSFATITATQGGKLSSYTCVYPTFMLRSNMSLSMFGITGNEAEMPVMEKDLYNSDIQVRYFFLDEPGYNPMAKRLRDELIEDGVLEAKNPGEIPLYIDLISGVEADRFVLGIKYQETLPMTTFKEAIGIHESLKERGAKTQVVNIQGWFNDGYYHDAINKVSLVKKLGTKKDLNSLKESIESSNGRLYLDADFQRVPLNSKGFNDARAGARYYGGGYVGTFGFVNPTSYANVSGLGYLERIYTLLSPKFLPRQIESFAKAIGKYPSSGVSARDLGEIIYSDKKRTEYISREESKDIIQAGLEELKGASGLLMVSGGNAYALKYARDVESAPLSSSSLYVLDEEIPFFAMVVHGLINYSGSAANIGGGSLEQAVLEAIESGASLRFAFTAKDASELKYTGLNHYYSVTFENWAEDAASAHKTLSSALDPAEGSLISSHEILAEGVRKVTYENGYQVTVNYSKKAYGDVPARGFKTEGGQAQ